MYFLFIKQHQHKWQTHPDQPHTIAFPAFVHFNAAIKSLSSTKCCHQDFVLWLLQQFKIVCLGNSTTFAKLQRVFKLRIGKANISQKRKNLYKSSLISNLNQYSNYNKKKKKLTDSSHSMLKGCRKIKQNIGQE